jgi:hypothetical protein
MSDVARVRLLDVPEESGRTTTTLLASLGARLGVLYLISGADAVGSLAAGIAALGRELSQTAEGARLRRRIEEGPGASNGELLWSKLRIGDWLSAIAPSPVLDEIRNDLALLIARDLGASLELMPIPGELTGIRADLQPQPVTFPDLMVGLWAYAREIELAVEALSAPAPARVAPAAPSKPPKMVRRRRPTS